MEDKTYSVTRADISDAIYRDIGLPYTESMDILDAVLDEITSSFLRDEDVKISSFGTFAVKHKTERVGRNPKTGVEAVISPRRVVSFKPSHILKNKVEAANKKG